MLGETRLREIADRVLREAKADQTEVLVTVEDSNLTRFAVNSIHQNVTETSVGVRVRSILGKKTGVASGNEISDEALSALVRSAEAAASFQKDNPDFKSLPAPQPIELVDAYVEATASFTPEERADAVRKILDAARSHRLEAAGSFSTEAEEICIANSLGVSAYQRRTASNVRTVVMGPDSSGYGADTSKDVRILDPGRVGREAVDKALQSVNPTNIEPGEYTVILEEEAVADMLRFLGWVGFNGTAFLEKRSFLTGRLGEKVTGDLITIWDDGRDPSGLPLAFDFEGVPKRKIMLIENGVAKHVVYDSFTAGRANTESTGHGLPSPSMFGPVPINMFMAPGTATKEEMLAATERGIWVTRFHYTNPVHPTKTIQTGMTRDGTFLIEDGKLARPVKNLRFTQSILEAFTRVDMISSTIQPVKSLYGGFVTSVPAIRTHGFRFTGTTEF